MPAQELLAVITGYVIVGFVALIGLIILVRIWQDKIQLDLLISEPNGDASLSRMQLLIFTFVIALTFFLIAVGGKDGPSFPQPIPAEVLTLLGISASSYLVSKGIQFSNPAGVGALALEVSPREPKVAEGQPPIQFTANAVGAGDSVPQVTWSIVAPAVGTLQNATGMSVEYVPDPKAAAGTQVKIQVTAAGYVPGEVTVTY